MTSPDIPQPSFDTMMANAQQAHQSGQFANALTLWQGAAHDAPDELERARALRGLSQSIWRGRILPEGTVDDPENLNPEHYANHYAQASYDIYAAHADADPRARREMVEGSRVMGRMALARGIGQELDGVNPNESYARAVSLFALTYRGIKRLRADDPRHPDQYEINALPDIAIASALGPRHLANTQIVASPSQIAKEARQVAWRSESASLPTAAQDVGRRYRVVARGKLLARARAATYIAGAATALPSDSRTRAVSLAAKPVIIGRR